MCAVRRTYRTPDETRALMSVARGEAPPDLLVTGGRVLNVYSGEVLPGAVAVAAGRIAYVGERPVAAGPSTIVVEAQGRLVAPGYIDPHGHPQAMYTPDELARTVLPRGTTAIVADTLMLLNLTVPEATIPALAALGALPLRYFWFLRLHGQAHSPHDPTTLSEERLEALLALDDVRALGEITRWTQVYAGDAGLLGRIGRGIAAGRRVEGHAPGVSADRLQALVAAGFSSDHEAITAEQALARLRAGLYVMLRHGSLRPDLPELAPVITGSRAYSGRIMLTPDGPNATFVHGKGYMEYLLEVALRAGVDPVAAYQMVTVNPATYFALDEEMGGLAPGRRADLVVLEGLDRPMPQAVVAAGKLVAQDGRLVADLPVMPWDRWLRQYAPGDWRPDPSCFTLDGLPSPAPVMHFENTVITRRRDVVIGEELPEGVLRMVLLDSAGRWRCRALLSGFAERIGGLASTYTSGAGVYVLGRDPSDMAVAASRALDLGGGVVLAEGGTVIFELPLPLGGMMSPRPMGEVAAQLGALTNLLRARGYAHHDLAYSLLFFGFDSLPYIRLTYRGLWDVVGDHVLLPREDL